MLQTVGSKIPASLSMSVMIPFISKQVAPLHATTISFRLDDASYRGNRYCRHYCHVSHRQKGRQCNLIPSIVQFEYWDNFSAHDPQEVPNTKMSYNPWHSKILYERGSHQDLYIYILPSRRGLLACDLRRYTPWLPLLLKPRIQRPSNSTQAHFPSRCKYGARNHCDAPAGWGHDTRRCEKDLAERKVAA